MDARAAPYIIFPPCLFIIILSASFIVLSRSSLAQPNVLFLSHRPPPSFRLLLSLVLLFLSVSLTTSSGLLLPLRLSPFSNELSRSCAGNQVLRDRTPRTKLTPRARLKYAFCIGKLANLAFFLTESLNISKMTS